ncbi:MAG: hypothetical protein H8F28_03000 [Fibrella sp.]|nr:hypothetical protein [Armatimonadota bacterium]
MLRCYALLCIVLLLLILPLLFAARVCAQFPVQSFADFEKSSFDGWIIEGDAFGSAPATEASFSGKIRGVGGSAFLCSLHLRKGNAATGRAISQDFTLTKPMITFKIAGGFHPREACINLVLDGKIVRTKTGEDSSQLITRSWDVSEFVGRTAHLEITDATASDRRGHILVDDIAFVGNDLAISLPTSESAPIIEIPIRVLHILDSQGTAEFTDRSRTVLTQALVEKQILAVNELFRPARIRFVCDPKEFETRRDDYLDLDFDAPAQRVRSGSADSKPAEIGLAEHLKAFQTVADERPDRLTLIAHRGSEWRWSERAKTWSVRLGVSHGGYGLRTDGRGYYIRTSSMKPRVWAHELGHALGLYHTSQDSVVRHSKTLDEVMIATACLEYIASGGDKEHPEHAIDGDYRTGVRDTPPNPGIGFWGTSRDRSRIIPLNLPGRETLYLFVTRDNIMASADGNDRFTNDQIRVMRRKAESWKAKQARR